MFPFFNILGFDLYEIMIFVGIISAFISFYVLSKKLNISYDVFKFALIVSCISLIIGFIGATIIQSLYNFIQTGHFELCGLTYLGGFVCSAIFFVIVYHVFSKKIFKNNVYTTEFNKVINSLIPSIILGHAFGRLGCLFIGCCYGIKSENFGFLFYINGEYESRIPTQLIESVFLFILYGISVYLIIKKNFLHELILYLYSYGIFRFFIEFLRDDNRGSIGISFLSPSQVISILLIILAIILTIHNKKRKN